MTETLNYDKKYWEKPCPQVDCRKDSCKCGLKRVFLPASLGDDGKDSPIAPKNGAYCDALVIYEANDHVYIYSKEGIPTLMTSGDSGAEEEINKLKRNLNNEVANRIEGDATLQNEIDDIKNSPDVVDIVATYADLQSYDTSKLGDNDIIRVLQDEEHDGQSTYYRWGKQSETWTYIGAVGDYYTKGQVDNLLSAKQNQLTAGSNVSIAQEGDDLVISATDTTYSNFVGTDGADAGSAGLVPAPATTDAGKFLKADGTWDTAGGGGPTVVQTLGNSQTDVMSQNAVTSAIYSDPSTRYNINIGGTGNPPNGGAVLLHGSSGSGNAIAIGNGSSVQANGGIALGAGAKATSAGEMNIGTPWTSYGYNNSNYRLISGVYDGQSAHDAATKGQMDASKGLARVLTSSDYNYDSNNDTINDTVALWLLEPGLYCWEYSFASNGGITFMTGSTSGGISNPNMRAFSSEVLITWLGDTTMKSIYCFNRNPDTSNSNFGYSPVVPIRVKVSDGTLINQTSQSYAIGAGDIFNNAVERRQIKIGDGASAIGTNSVAIGYSTYANQQYSVAIGEGSNATAKGVFAIGTTGTHGYNNSAYRLLTGLYDGRSDHDAVTLGQLKSRIISSLTSAPTTSTVGAVGALVATVESGTGHLYICTDDTGGTYTWQQLV